MSGIAAIFNLDGAPVERRWLESMADSLIARGPDFRATWARGEIGLCHTLLATSSSERNAQPCRLDDVWISADARIDDRGALASELQAHTRVDVKTTTSAELILQAYRAWGERLVDHLLGDFAFILWDSAARRLVCARDQLGIKPLYYARVRNCLLVSNTLECLRQLPAVSRTLNDRAVGDFLISDINWDPGATLFADIQRIPAAHVLVASPSGVELRRYWNLPIEEPLGYRRGADYVDQFRELLETATSDRLPGGPVGVFMSGGLDSSGLAATAVRLGASTKAFTQVFDRLIPDEERHYATLVADHLQIPIRFRAANDVPFGWTDDSTVLSTPEPVDNPLGYKAYLQYCREISTSARVVLYGEGPDNALTYEWRSCLSFLLRQGAWGEVVRATARHAATQRRVPLLSTIPRMWSESRAREPQPSFPGWLDEDFTTRTNLRERWDQVRRPQHSMHPVKPRAHGSFCSMVWPAAHEALDASCSSAALEIRHPYLDLRLLQFLLKVPAIPWCRNKHLMREGFRGWIPEPVRLRPKTPLAGSPDFERARLSETRELAPHEVSSRYINWESLRQAVPSNRGKYETDRRARRLNSWLYGVTLSAAGRC